MKRLRSARDLIQSQSDLETQSAQAQEEVRTLSEQLAGMDLAEVAIPGFLLEHAPGGCGTCPGGCPLGDRMNERREVERFDTRRFELTTRLQEAETSLSGLDDEQIIPA